MYTRKIFLASGAKDAYQLVFLDKGELLLTDGGKVRHYTSPAILLLHGPNSISMPASRGNEGHNFIFTPDALNVNWQGDKIENDDPSLFILRPFMNLHEKGYSCRTLPPEYNKKLGQLCAKVDSHLNEQTIQEFWPCLSRSYFLEILLLIDRTHYISNEQHGIPVPDTGTKIDDILVYMHTHYNERISLGELCSNFATNRTTLNKLFTEICGMSAINYLNQLRLDVAKSLMENTLLPVSEIAQRIGIDDIAYFGRTFKRKTGMPPSVFRKSVPSPY
ncbi:MAG: helix-turn-helix transcriptional regulator [Spirochaetales bacterium]|nr:helix-turn-helix transcriptional regulator [Spirochaetales bacterium]